MIIASLRQQLLEVDPQMWLPILWLVKQVDRGRARPLLAVTVRNRGKGIVQTDIYISHKKYVGESSICCWLTTALVLNNTLKYATFLWKKRHSMFYIDPDTYCQQQGE